jgi:hypothetical protein
MDRVVLSGYIMLAIIMAAPFYARKGYTEIAE